MYAHTHMRVYPHVGMHICTQHIYTTHIKMSRKADGCGGGKDNSGSLHGGSLTESSFRPLLIGSTSEPHRSLGRCLAILWQWLRSTPSQGRAWFACELYLLKHTGILHSATAGKAFSSDSSALGPRLTDTKPAQTFPWCECKSCLLPRDIFLDWKK